MKYVFDNSNLNESYSGITTPLTYSFARRVYASVYIQLCLFMGVGKQTIENHKELYPDMLAFIAGRMYYNLTRWHEMISLFPFYSVNGQFLEQMMGLDVKHQGSINIHGNKQIKASLLTLIRMIWIFITMPLWEKLFSGSFQKSYSYYTSLLSHKHTVRDKMRIYEEAEKKLTRDFRIPIANDFAVMISCGLLKQILKKKYKDDGKIFHSLIGNTVGLKSSEPGKALSAIVTRIQSQEKAMALFQNESPNNIYKLLNTPGLLGIKRLIDAYSTEYGFRIPGELKLESITFLDTPENLVSFLSNLVKHTSYRQSGTQQENSNHIHISSPSVLFLSAWASSSIRIRESTRFKRAQVFRLARDTFISIANDLVEQNKLKNPRDIFFLTVEEVKKIVNNSKLNALSVIESRKKEERNFRTVSLPSHIVSNKKSPRISQFTNPPPPKLPYLLGTVASMNNRVSISGEALVLKEFDPVQDFHGKILVTKQTDPGWTIVFPFLKGLVVERGGMLSHAAIVAREFGLPCIIGVADATLHIENGAHVTLQLDTGAIRWTNT